MTISGSPERTQSVPDKVGDPYQILAGSLGGLCLTTYLA